jgi:hypothetical protein
MYIYEVLDQRDLVMQRDKFPNSIVWPQTDFNIMCSLYARKLAGLRTILVNVLYGKRIIRIKQRDKSKELTAPGTSAMGFQLYIQSAF